MNTFVLDFVSIGPQRTGTSWLHQILKQHPQICCPQDVKETMFFDRDYAKGITWYADYFCHQHQGQICGEVAPTYFDVAAIPDRIHAVNPNCKILISLRHPVGRALSLYHHHLSKGRVQGSFSQAVIQMPRIIEAGRYATHIPRWLDRFDPGQLLFLLLEDIESDPVSVLHNVYRFLNIQPIDVPALGYEKFGAATMPTYPQLAKIAAQGATWLRRRRLHKLAEWGKAWGLKRVYAGQAAHLPKLTLHESAHLLEQYQIDIRFVEQLLHRDLAGWRDPSTASTYSL
ncbi:MAG: sulfotransferase domain-containing protein [Elainella sp. Prado103]|jgi:hypothetical protein|nr:sulfotransferase domain-containing protein [Elainella sp. Prado103]